MKDISRIHMIAGLMLEEIKEDNNGRELVQGEELSGEIGRNTKNRLLSKLALDLVNPDLVEMAYAAKWIAEMYVKVAGRNWYALWLEKESGNVKSESEFEREFNEF